MTYWHENAFHSIYLLWMKSNGHKRFLSQKTSSTECWCFHYFQPDQVVECQRSYWSLETLWRSLNIIVIVSSSISAIVTSLCLVLYVFLVYDGPDTHPRISWRERRYIEAGVGHLEGVGRWSNKFYMYRQIFDIRCTKSKKRNVSRLVLQLFCVTYWS